MKKKKREKKKKGKELKSRFQGREDQRSLPLKSQQREDGFGEK